MRCKYLKNLFEMSLLDMATGQKSLRHRIASAYRCHLFKIQWDKDIRHISKEEQPAFLELKKLLCDDIELVATEQRQKDRELYFRRKCPITDEQLAELVTYDSMRRQMHWRKAKRAAELMYELYKDLLFSLSEQGRKNVY